jgi:integrase
LARRRYQKGSVFLRGGKWVGRWREDEIRNGRLVRIRRSRVLGTKAELPTKRLALRVLAERVAVVNSVSYRPRPTATFAELAKRWECSVLPQFAPSTQVTMRGHLRKWLVLFFGPRLLQEIQKEDVQQFVAWFSSKVAPKTVRNIVATGRLVWKAAMTWGYVSQDCFAGVRLPRQRRANRLSFSLEELRRILEEAEEPYRTFYWLAAETGLRAGELCGLRVADLDLPSWRIAVWQSAYRGKIQAPKTDHAYRVVPVSGALAAHLAAYLERWRPNREGLLFASRNGTPWDANLVVKRKLYPLLNRLNIPRAGLHAFRHANATLLDRVNAPLGVRRERLGHSDARVTIGTYTHAEEPDQRRVAEALGQLLSPKSAALDLDGPTVQNWRVVGSEQPVGVH